MRSFFFFILAFFTTFSPSFGEKGVWVEGSYRYYFGEFEVPINACKKARSLALRKAINKALSQGKLKVRISSKTVVFNGRLALDMISELAAIKAENIKIISERKGSDEKGLYCEVMLKAFLSEDTFELADFGLTLKLPKKEFRSGEKIENLFIGSQKPCYPYLYSVAADGTIYRLLPNKYQKPFLLKGIKPFPTDSMKKEGIELRVYTLPSGVSSQEEQLLLICTRERDEFLERVFPDALAEEQTDILKILSPKYRTTMEEMIKHLYQLPLDAWSMEERIYKVKR